MEVKCDVDGNEFVDYVMGMGPNIFGHAPNLLLNQFIKICKMDIA